MAELKKLETSRTRVPFPRLRDVTCHVTRHLISPNLLPSRPLNRRSSRMTKRRGTCHALTVLIVIVTCIDTEKSVTLKRQQLASDGDALPDVTTPGALRPEEISSDAPHGSIVLYMTKQSE